MSHWLAATALAVLVVSCAADDEPPPAARPNLVLFLIDTLRADRLGAYGYERPVSPHLDVFAADAVLFEHAVAQSSWTRPAMVSIFTGLVPQQHGVNGRLARLPEGATTLAEVLADAGYENAAFVANANMARRFGVAQGFASYRMMKRWDSRGEPLVAEALKWLDARTDPARPFFLYLHIVEPHAPYRPPDDLLQRFARGPAPLPEPPGRSFMKRLGSGEVDASPVVVDWLDDLYDGEVASADAAFASLVAGLDERGLYDDAVVAVLSDHGEELHDHGGWEHGKTLHGEVLDVPLMLRLPRGPRGARVAEPVQHADLFPTLLEAMAIEAPAPGHGRSLLPLLRGAVSGSSRAAARAAGRDQDDQSLVSLLDVEELRVEAVTSGDWRLIRRKTPEGLVEELYRRSDDPGETRNLATDEPETVARLASRLDAAAAASGNTPFGEEPEPAVLDRKLARRLRALGYL